MGLLDKILGLFKATPSTTSRTVGTEEGGMVDAYRRVRHPNSWDLLNELKNTAYACAVLNSGVCASYTPKLYVRTRKGERAARCLTKALPWGHPLVVEQRGLAQVEQVLEHPLLTLLEQVNPRHNKQDLWELTTLCQEVHGSAYWLIEDGALGIPETIWPLAVQCVTPRREPGSSRLVDYYEYRANGRIEKIEPERIIHFFYPDPRDPYGGGLSPLRGCYELASLGSQFLAYRRAIVDNHAMPAAIVSPTEVIGEEEASRLEQTWNQRFRRGGNGRVLVAESSVKVDLLANQWGDVNQLAAAGATMQDIANAFGVPLSLLTTTTNLANLQAAEAQHAKTIYAKILRRDEKLNEQLVPRFDDSGRLFLASEDPRPIDRDFRLREEYQDLVRGVRTINEVRAERGLPPVPWGNQPFKPSVGMGGAE